MAISSTHDKLLDQLQGEVNRVLEHTGKLFAAVASDNGKAASAGHVVKLKRLFPDSNQRFHQALDELEGELQMAKLVMRRDLALCREKSGVQVPRATNQSPAIKPSIEEEEAIEAKVESTSFAPANDVEMEDSQPTANPVEPIEPSNDASVGGIESSKHDPMDPFQPDQEDPAIQEVAQPTENTSGAQEDPPMLPEPQPNALANETTSHDMNLHIDTEALPDKNKTTDEPGTDANNPPDTGTFSNTNDLDSLFGGPLSAGAGDAPEFNLEATGADDFDFDAFANSLESNANANDDIASLLPGLEEYANPQPAGADDIDFDALFATNLSGNGDGQMEGGPSHIPHRDSTFDGLTDLGDFDVNQFTAGADGNGSNNENGEFDFFN